MEYGQVDVVIEGSTGSRLNVIVSFEYPGVLKDYFHTVEKTPARLRADFSQEVAEAEEVYKGMMEKIAGSGIDSALVRQKMPAINIIRLYQPGGGTRRVFVAYDTVSYYKEPEGNIWQWS